MFGKKQVCSTSEAIIIMEDLKKIVDKFVSDQKLGNKYVI